MAVRFTYHGSPFASQIQQQGFKPGTSSNSLRIGNRAITLADLFQKGPKAFTSTSPKVASMYGSNIPVASSTRNLSLPSGGITGSGVRFGTEVVQTPGQFNKGMNLASKVGKTYTGPTAQRLMSGATVSGLGAPRSAGILSRLAGGPFGMASMVGTGIGYGVDQLARAINTPEEYEAMKQSARDQSGFGYFDDVDISQPPGTDVGIMSNLADLFGSSARADEIEPIDVENFLEANRLKSTPDVVDVNRIPGRIQEAVEPQKGITTLRDKLGSLKAKGIDVGRMALSGIGRLAAGPIGGIVGGIIGGLANQFENRPLGANVIDEFGNVYDFNELNKQNALGGYYTDAARSARRRTRRIANLLERQKLGKKFSQKNLEKLLEQEKAQEAAQRSAMDAMFARGEGGSGQDFTGGRYDGAGSKGAYDANPTGFSGSN